MKLRSLASAAGILAALMVAIPLGGCGGGLEEAIRSFTGGTRSKDKKEIPEAVDPPSGSAESTPQLAAAEASLAPGMEARGVAPQGMGSASNSSGGSHKAIRESSMEYRAARRRDPFRALVGKEEVSGDLIDLSVVKLVGIVWGEDPFCIVEDAEGVSHVLHKGDRVKHGRVVSIKKDAMIASQTILGYTTTVQLKLVERKDRKHE